MVQPSGRECQREAARTPAAVGWGGLPMLPPADRDTAQTRPCRSRRVRSRVTTMRRQLLPLLLVFLLLSGITDDLFASFTEDPQDTDLAAANNTYLTGREAHNQLREPGPAMPSPASPRGAAPDLGAPHLHALAGRTRVPPGGTELLYALMS